MMKVYIPTPESLLSFLSGLVGRCVIHQNDIPEIVKINLTKYNMMHLYDHFISELNKVNV